jgi:hypothetical protein
MMGKEQSRHSWSLLSRGSGIINFAQKIVYYNTDGPDLMSVQLYNGANVICISTETLLQILIFARATDR